MLEGKVLGCITHLLARSASCCLFGCVCGVGLRGFLASVQVTQSLPDIAFLNCRPSVIAAAIVYAERRSRGIIPFWPSMLSKLSGYQVHWISYHWIHCMAPWLHCQAPFTSREGSAKLSQCALSGCVGLDLHPVLLVQQLLALP